MKRIHEVATERMRWPRWTRGNLQRIKYILLQQAEGSGRVIARHYPASNRTIILWQPNNDEARTYHYPWGWQWNTGIYGAGVYYTNQIDWSRVKIEWRGR